MALGSSLLFDEYFEAADTRFLDELYVCQAEKKLKALGERWFKDARPEARWLLERYIDDGCDRPHHRPLVKKLFKLAEEHQDDALMGRLMVAFDRLMKRKISSKGGGPRLVRDPSIPSGIDQHRFSAATRQYLARRVFRYFRRLGHSDPARYGQAMRAALVLYDDERTSTVEQLLDSWSLLHVIYWGSSVLDRKPDGIEVRPGRTLGELRPAPIYPETWKGHFEELITMLGFARSRTVRSFVIAQLGQHEEEQLRKLALERTLFLLRSPHEEVQTFAAGLLEHASGLDAMPLPRWFELLKIDNPFALPLLAKLVEQHVHPDRLSLAQAIELACASAAPVAQLGLTWAKQKPIKTAEELKVILALAGAPAPKVREEATAWLLSQLETHPEAKPEHLRELIDSKFADVRKAGVALFERHPRMKDDTGLWSAVSETPYDDVRAFLVKHLGERERALSKEDLLHVWASSLLAIHRGGRAKRMVLGQLAKRVVQRTDEADRLLPLLALSLRSVRPTDRRAALAALSQAAFRAPVLRAAIQARLPELRLFEEEPPVKLDLRYLGKSGVVAASWGLALRFSPNLARPKVFFDAEILRPIRFREAISALHDVVVGDLRFKKRDKTAYLAWKKQQEDQQRELLDAVRKNARQAAASKLDQPIPPNLEGDFRKMHSLYWTARRSWASELSRNDPELFRHLVPCDPVVTVARDTVYFECFSKDESSYGCLSVDRDAFKAEGGVGLGTTNVDYSLSLYEHFQTLRTYRASRLQVDPAGFEVKVEGLADYREEKIDLPPSWLRGFGQLQSAMTLPTRKVELPTELVYSILAYLKRHREMTGPRSIRFKLSPGKPPVVVLDPWNVELVSFGRPYEGDKEEEIKIWGRRRLMTLARLLPLAERFEVRLLGSGLPSIWIAHLGEMRLTLALSGWTANDWTSGSNLDLLAGNFDPDPLVIDQLSRYLLDSEQASMKVLAHAAGSEQAATAALQRLAKQGQVVYDFAASTYRYRQVMPEILSEALLGPEHPELVEARDLHQRQQVKLARLEPLPGGRTLVIGSAGHYNPKEVEAVFDQDGGLSKAKCECSYFYKNRLRAGPCRHLLALRMKYQQR